MAPSSPRPLEAGARGARVSSRSTRVPTRARRLAARFWPDVLDESARASLRVALTELRQALGPAAGYLVATRETVALDGPDLASTPARSSWRSATAIPSRALEACSGSDPRRLRRRLGPRGA